MPDLPFPGAAAVTTQKEVPPAKNDRSMSEKIMGIYPITGKSWYQVFPYVFSIEDLASDKNFYRYALPIPPESLVVQMLAPVEAIPTLGGVVEEPSSVVFWSIQMTGSCGIAPSRADDNYDQTKDNDGTNVSSMANSFRTSLTKTGLLSGLISNLTGPIDKVAGIADAFSGEGFLSALQAAVQPKLPYTESAVNGISNGYTEIYRLHKFFIFYSGLNSRKDAENNSYTKDFAKSNYGLFFYNNKDNQKFRIVLKNFMIIKTQNSPFLYRYQIQFKGWNLQPVSDKGPQNAVDRFKTDLKTVNTLSITSLINSAKNTLRSFNSLGTDPLSTFVSVPPVV